MCRTEKKLDWERVDEMLQAGCLGTEIAAVYDMHPNTFYEKVNQKFKISFTQYCQQIRSKGDSLLREAQFKKAVKKLDNTMLIWLGKNRLGQRESVSEFTISDDVMKPFIAVMNQINGLQEARKSSESNVSSELKSV